MKYRERSHVKLKESSVLSGVEAVCAEIVGCYDSRRIGEKHIWGSEDYAYFHIDCRFSECYGPDKGFDFDSAVYGMVREQRDIESIRVCCGGRGDTGHGYCCDDWVELMLTVTYRTGSGPR